MKAITAIAAASLLLGVTAASAQMPSSSESKPGATMNTPAAGANAHHARRTGMSAPHRSTTGSSTTGSSSEPAVTGTTPGSNPNPSWNKNPDSEVPGNTEE